MKGKIKSWRPCERFDDVEDDLNIKEKRNCHTVARSWKEWRRILFEAKVQN
jgi:hypothetical protein